MVVCVIIDAVKLIWPIGGTLWCNGGWIADIFEITPIITRGDIPSSTFIRLDAALGVKERERTDDKLERFGMRFKI